MLRALTSYFFGGIEDETPEAPIECETREVNDWLVVNFPDQNSVSVSLNEDDSAYVIDDEDIRSEIDDGDDEVDASDENEMELDEDDVLFSLSLLMPPDAETISSEFSNEQSFYKNIVMKPLDFSPDFCPIVSSPFRERSDLISIADMRLTTEMVRAKMAQYFNRQNLDVSLLRSKVPCWSSLSLKRKDIIKEYETVKKMVQVCFDPAIQQVSSKNYVNHRHPEKILNHDLLQRIKELEPEQRAVQRSIKKNITRGQLNRQNNNYMYETSSKRNRRCNRQRNHSGANNNRKC